MQDPQTVNGICRSFDWLEGGRGQEAGTGNDCADLQGLELKTGREGTLQHGPGAILEGAIGSCLQSGWLREILGPEGCPRTCFKTVTKR
jgi:hypothetical protein